MPPKPPPPRPAATAAVSSENGRAGIAIGVLLPALPELARLGARFENPRADAARRAVGFAEQRDALFGVREAAESPFCSRHFGWVPANGAASATHLIAERHFVLQVPSVERFDPGNRRRLIRTPAITARAGLHAVDRYAFARGHVGDLFDDFAAAVPYLDFVWESVHRHEPRERPLDSRNEDVLAIGRRRDVFEDPRAADQRLAPGIAVDRRELACEVVLEQVLVVIGLDHVLEGRGRRGLAVVLLDVGAGRHGRLGGRGPAAGRHELAQQRDAVLEPVDRIAGCPFNRSVPLTNLDRPVVVSATQSSMPFSFVLVKESRLPSGEKLTPPMFGLGGTATLISVPSAIDFKVMPVSAAALLAPVGFWVDARAGDPVDRLGQIGDRGHASPVEQRDRAAVWRDDHAGCRRRVENVDDDFGRHQVTRWRGRLLACLPELYGCRSEDERSGKGERFHSHGKPSCFSTGLELFRKGLLYQRMRPLEKRAWSVLDEGGVIKSGTQA